jgi:hypothetical protein
MQELARRSGGGTSAYVRVIVSFASAVILTFYATQIFYTHGMKLPLKIGVILVMAAIGFGGIHSLLTPEPEEEPVSTERLYTAGEVAALVAAVQSGRLVVAAPDTCKFCGDAQPDVTGVDGSHYHQRCFQTAYQSGKT